nr:DUF4159 domain-containing protein [Jiella mangrovi]
MSFGAPFVLAGLLALPVIWWLLKLTPPRPQVEAFPPLRILQRVLKSEETPSKSPWWLTLLRLLLATLVILALAAPTLNPSTTLISGSGPLAILVDNGWASGADYDQRRRSAEEIIRQAGDAGRPVVMAFSAEGADDDASPVEAAGALERLAASQPRPVPTNRLAAARRIATALEGERPGSLVFLSDGLDSTDAAEAASTLAALTPTQTIVYEPSLDNVVGITNADNSTEALVVSAVRPAGLAGGAFNLVARDAQSREIGSAPIDFSGSDGTGEARFQVPVEMRNDIARIEVEGASTAGAVRLLDDSFRRRRVALVSGESADAAQPLLSPLYYISRALGPFADLVRPSTADLAKAIPELLERKPSVVILADIGVLPEEARTGLEKFVENGGYLVRFAGPRLAATTGEDPLVPVRLRAGERQLGGAMSWSEPQKLAPMSETSPFAGIAVPEDVTVSRQILAEPSADLADHTWASLADGTPLVTARSQGAGTIVLFHVTAEATWSNLPISGAFVSMLRRIVSLSRANGGARDGQSAAESLPPYRLLDGTGRLVSPGPEAQPLVLAADQPAPVDLKNPPGLYGSEDGYVAHNLFSPSARLAALPALDFGAAADQRPYANEDSTDLRPWLFAAALVLFALDAFAMLWLNGGLARFKGRLSGRPAGTAVSIVFLALIGTAAAFAFLQAAAARAQTIEQSPQFDVQKAIEATAETHLAYVETGDDALDERSLNGLRGLSQYIAAKTALEPGKPMGVDIATDELSFYPLLYWPIDAGDPMPTPDAISRIDAYMKQGGTVLFDVNDDALSSLSGTVSPGQRRLRDILGDLDIPPLEPVPSDHVLTKAFYILSSFPGLHSDSPLWVESMVPDASGTARPARGGDGVSSIMITSNDFAGAWAVDDKGLFLYPTDSSDPYQREYAYRAGVNIVMYVLTGNYKADQVHVPALLERLGQ